MLNVFFTSDVEVWCKPENKGSGFNEAFKQHIFGEVTEGEYGIPFQMKVLSDHGLKGVFFNEPLFSSVFGIAPLQEMNAIVMEAGHEVQLHLHAEWARNVSPPMIQGIDRSFTHMHHFDLDQQAWLISKGLELMEASGCSNIKAFRAGNFGSNNETLKALEKNSLFIDSSFNATHAACKMKLPPEYTIHRSKIGNVMEYPMTAFEDYPGHQRHVQLCACSFNEIKKMLLQAVEKGWDSFVILSHSFELIDRSSLRVNKLVLKRFRKLCQFLEDNCDIFNCIGFNDANSDLQENMPKPLNSSLVLSGHRMFEQLLNRF